MSQQHCVLLRKASLPACMRTAAVLHVGSTPRVEAAAADDRPSRGLLTLRRFCTRAYAVTSAPASPWKHVGRRALPYPPPHLLISPSLSICPTLSSAVLSAPPVSYYLNSSSSLLPPRPSSTLVSSSTHASPLVISLSSPLLSTLLSPHLLSSPLLSSSLLFSVLSYRPLSPSPLLSTPILSSFPLLSPHLLSSLLPYLLCSPPSHGI